MPASPPVERPESSACSGPPGWSAPSEVIVVERVLFPSGAYRLEGELVYGAGDAHGAALIAGPHPFLGGNMHNNVTRGLGDGLAERNLLTLRFNYRGVGGSDGPVIDMDAHLAEFWQTSHVADEMELANDVQAAADFLSHLGGSHLGGSHLGGSHLGGGGPVVLIGYSFGCALLPAIQVKGLSAFVLIAPTIGKHQYETFRAIRKPILVIISDDDFATDPHRVRDWFEKLSAPKKLVQNRLDNHFFRGHESWLAEMVADFLGLAWR